MKITDSEMAELGRRAREAGQLALASILLTLAGELALAGLPEDDGLMGIAAMCAAYRNSRMAHLQAAQAQQETDWPAELQEVS